MLYNTSQLGVSFARKALPVSLLCLIHKISVSSAGTQPSYTWLEIWLNTWSYLNIKVGYFKIIKYFMFLQGAANGILQSKKRFLFIMP